MHKNIPKGFWVLGIVVAIAAILIAFNSGDSSPKMVGNIVIQPESRELGIPSFPQYPNIISSKINAGSDTNGFPHFSLDFETNDEVSVVRQYYTSTLAELGWHFLVTKSPYYSSAVEFTSEAKDSKDKPADAQYWCLRRERANGSIYFAQVYARQNNESELSSVNVKIVSGMLSLDYVNGEVIDECKRKSD